MEIKTCEEPTCAKQIVMLRSVRQPGKWVPVDLDSVTSDEANATDTEYDGAAGHVTHFKTCTRPDRFASQLHRK